ncbi:glycosyltransferase family 25 protein [Isoalcanivorax indicus]|uniref:glycosyltransferase family 25 protein n=1 Tax=Isoalcanivorax indicus TaxID=2202653 RepID=UPI000DB98AC8|nr:glycosyltransferase family 25 protein [Isoalcanivorax indicus]
MKTYVISLADSLERRRAAAEQLSQAGVNFEFFDALRCDIRQLVYFSRYDEREYVLNCGRPAAMGEVGCYASHKMLWQRCVDDDEPVMIMEDDFLLADHFHEAACHAERLVHEYGYIRLQTERRATRRLVRHDGQFSLVRYSKVPHSAMCYVISPSVAARLLRRADVLDAPLDVMVKKNWEHGCQIYGLMPYSVSEHCLSKDTTIPGRARYKKPVLVSLRRAIRKLVWLARQRQFGRLMPGD